MKAVSLFMTCPGPHSKSVSGLGIGKQNLDTSFVQFLLEYALLGHGYVTKGPSTEAHIMSSPSSENEAEK